MLQIPPDAQGSHEAVIALVEKAFSTGLSANLRVVVAKEPNAPDAAWRPACARLDLARDGHPCPLDCRPRGPVRVLEERIGASEFVARLRSAYAGDAFRVCDDLIAGHGFDLPLVAYHHPDDWRDYGSEWPCIVVAPSAGIRQRPYLSCCIEDDGPAAIFNGLEHLVRHVMAFAETPGAGIDVRFSRFQILIWDYRGRIDRLDYDRGRLTVEVTPKGDRALKLIGFAANGQVRIPIKEEAPTIIEVPIAGAVANAEVELKAGDDLVAEGHWTFSDGDWLAASTAEPPTLPADQASDLSPVDTLANATRAFDGSLGATVLDLDATLARLTFMTNPPLRRVVRRDLYELWTCLEQGANKASLVLCGSILEAVLLDVLGRRSDLAGSYMKTNSKWPRDASLSMLIEIATGIEVRCGGGPVRHLVSGKTAELSRCLTDHRDLVHPHAEVRGDVKVNADVVVAMVGLLRVIIGDLAEAHETGVVAAYENL